MIGAGDRDDRRVVPGRCCFDSRRWISELIVFGNDEQLRPRVISGRSGQVFERKDPQWRSARDPRCDSWIDNAQRGICTKRPSGNENGKQRTLCGDRINCCDDVDCFTDAELMAAFRFADAAKVKAESSESRLGQQAKEFAGHE